MRILQVAPTLSSKYGGGGLTILKNLVIALAKRKHDVAIFTSDFGVKTDVVDVMYELNVTKEKRVWVLPFKTLFSLATLRIMNSSKARLECVFNPCEGKIDVIHMQGCRTWQNVIAHKWAKKYGIPYIVDAHGFPIEGTFLRKLFIRLFDLFFANRIVRDARFCIAETETGVKEYLRAGVNRENIMVIPCPYDLSVFDSLPKKGRFKKKFTQCGGKRIVLYLGGLDYIKGLDFLVKAFARLNQEDTVLVMVGEDMGFKKTLVKMVDDLGVQDKVIFTGGLYGQDKLEALVDADVAVFPSRAEQGLPFAALEAIMCGTPIIVSRGTGATDDIYKMRCGYVYNSEGYNFPHLAQSINFVFSVSSKELQQIMAIGQSYIRKNLSITEKVKDYEDLYERCMKR